MRRKLSGMSENGSSNGSNGYDESNGSSGGNGYGSNDGENSGKLSGSATLAYLILCGTSGWALRCTSVEAPWTIGTFSFLLGHGLIGVIRFGHPESSKKIAKLYSKTLYIAEYLPIPLINVEFYLREGMGEHLAYAHLTCAVIPLITHFVMDKPDRVVDVIIVGNVATLIYLSVTREKYWLGALAALALINQFGIKYLSKKFSVPKFELSAIGLSFFNIFAVQCLYESNLGL